ncbi:protein SAND-like [Anneissia japonica]|uniref:protein SAND-like n=1 Tax=Anneissia japonica TaxID=1529436 RepID=UPI001425B3F4|nr:protein SAND-like [Anneissia japonica]
MSENDVVSDVEEADVSEGQEPGASGTPMLAPSEDVLESLEYYTDTAERQRLPSGPIHEIIEYSLPELEEEIQEEKAEGDAAEIKDGEQKTEEGSLQGAIDDPFQPSTSDSTATADDTVKEEDGENAVSKEESKERERTASVLSECDAEDELNNKEWQQQKKHVFVLSEAGKPIYTRHGSEDKQVTLMGVMQALVSFISVSKNTLRLIVAGDHKFVFMVRSPLLLVAVANSKESHQQVYTQLTYVYNQILSVLTLTTLQKVFHQRHNYDLRRLLTGTEKFLDNLCHLMETDPCFLLSGVRCLPLESQVRDQVSSSLQSAKLKDLVFAILLADDQLVALVRMKKYVLHPGDLHLVVNLVNASSSFRNGESWTPICLPRFDSSGFLHAYVSYLEDTPACLLLLTVDKDVFFDLSDCKNKIVEKMKKHNCLDAITSSVRKGSYRCQQVGIPDLCHFIYKSRSTSQFTSPQLDAPYKSPAEQERLFGLYQYLHQRMHSKARPLKIMFHVSQHEALLGWVTSGFELYATFGALTTKPAAIIAINKLLKWIKREEERLFILNAQTF